MDINLSELGIEFRTKGDEANLKFCPFCEGQDDGDFTHMSVNIIDGVYHCVKCDAAGTYKQLKNELGVGDNRNIFRSRQYIRPPQVDYSPKAETFYSEYASLRGIDEAVLRRFHVGETARDGKRIVIYSFINEKGVLVNRKYRSLTDKKTMWVERGAELIYYGQQLLKPQNIYGWLMVCEGEDDCHALYQMGFENVVSVPQGCKSYTPAMHKVNAKYDQIFLFYDADEKGQAGAEKFAEMAGMHKCYNVLLPKKDARDCLLAGIGKKEIEDLMAMAKRFEHDEIKKAEAFSDSLIAHYMNPNSSLGRQTGNRRFDKLLGGIRRGELTSCTGHTGTGKSTFALNLTVWLAKNNGHCLVISLENKMRQTIQKMVTINSKDSLFGENSNGFLVPTKTPEWIRHEIKELSYMPIWFFDSEADKKGYFDIEKMETVIDYAVKFHSVEFVVLDHLEYFLKASGERKVDLINETMRRLKNITRKLNVHICLLAHPSKTQDKNGELAELGINGFKGASSIQQESDNIFILQKTAEGNKYQGRLKIEKNREMGKTGDVIFDVGTNMNSYTESTEGMNNA